MKPEPPLSPKCLFVGWMLGWATAVYLPSLLIALLSLSPLVTGANLLADTFQVADEVSPAAKLAFAVVFGGLVAGLRIARARRRIFTDSLVGVIGMIVVVAFLPQAWSRGFGIGLTGIRFDPVPTMIYAAGGVLAGVVLSLSEARCVRRSRPPARHRPATD